MREELVLQVLRVDVVEDELLQVVVIASAVDAVLERGERLALRRGKTAVMVFSASESVEPSCSACTSFTLLSTLRSPTRSCESSERNAVLLSGPDEPVVDIFGPGSFRLVARHAADDLVQLARRRVLEEADDLRFLATRSVWPAISERIVVSFACTEVAVPPVKSVSVPPCRASEWPASRASWSRRSRCQWCQW